MAVVERTESFASRGIACTATVFEPASAPSRGPCIVMAHGLGAVRGLVLPRYARAFAEAGYRVVSFDYRCWGDSEGTPRRLISIRRQLEDWRSAIDFARSLSAVDPSRVALWGTSLSGGHVIVAAARDARVAAVAAQCPMMDGRAALLHHFRYSGLRAELRLTALGLRDLLRSALGRSPVYVPTSAPPGTLALMSTEDADSGIDRLFEDSDVAPYPRDACARIALTLGFYRPIQYARRVRCPTLILVCTRDSVAPPKPAEAVAERIGDRARLVRCDFGHFELYVDAGFSFSAAQHLKFFREVLPAS